MVEEPIENLFQFLRGQKYKRDEMRQLRAFFEMRSIDCPIDDDPKALRKPTPDEMALTTYLHQESCQDSQCPWHYEELENKPKPENVWIKGRHHNKWLAIARKNPGLGTEKPTMSREDQADQEPQHGGVVIHGQSSNVQHIDPDTGNVQAGPADA